MFSETGGRGAGRTHSHHSTHDVTSHTRRYTTDATYAAEVIVFHAGRNRHGIAAGISAAKN